MTSLGKSKGISGNGGWTFRRLWTRYSCTLETVFRQGGFIAAIVKIVTANHGCKSELHVILNCRIPVANESFGPQANRWEGRLGGIKETWRDYVIQTLILSLEDETRFTRDHAAIEAVINTG